MQLCVLLLLYVDVLNVQRRHALHTHTHSHMHTVQCSRSALSPMHTRWVDDELTPDTQGWPPLSTAVYRWKNDAAQALLDAGAVVDAVDSRGNTALHWAAHADNADAVDMLVNAHANTDIANRGGQTPLHMAAARSCRTAFSSLRRAGASIDTPNALGQTVTDVADIKTGRMAGWGGNNRVLRTSRPGSRIHRSEDSTQYATIVPSSSASSSSVPASSPQAYGSSAGNNNNNNNNKGTATYAATSANKNRSSAINDEPADRPYVELCVPPTPIGHVHLCSLLPALCGAVRTSRSHRPCASMLFATCLM